MRRSVTLAATDAGDAPVLEAIRAHLAGLPLVVLDNPGRGPSEGGPGPPWPCAAERGAAILAAVCVDRERSGALVVYLKEGQGATTLVRWIPPLPGGTAVALEEIGVAVRSLLQALLDGGHVGIAAATPPVSATTVPMTKVSLRAGYVGTLLSSDVQWQSGVDIAAIGRILGPIRAQARYSFVPTLSASVPGSSAMLNLERHPFDVSVGWAGGGVLAPEAWVGMWFDSVHRSTAITGSDLRATGDQSDWTIGVSLTGGVSGTPFPRVHVYALGGFDVAFRRASYVVQGAAGTALTLGWLRPRVQLGLGVDVW